MSDGVETFSQSWQDRGDEKSDTQKFWLSLLHDVLGVEDPVQFIEFEKHVELEHVSFIDGYIPSTGIIIEQKSIDVNLDAPSKQSDGMIATPFQQAKRYYDWLPVSQRGRYIVTCNFREFRVYDMEHPREQPEVITLSSLAQDWRKLSCLVDINSKSPKEIHELQISIRAGELVGKLYDALLPRYINPNDPASQRSLNVFCVRLVFLLYAEDSGLLGKSQFHDYLKARELVARNALRDLFDVLNQKPDERDPYLEAALKDFPYINGGIFEERDIELPQLDGEPLRIILEDMSEGFDWSGISPTIFGAVFESTLNPQTRHTGGMHYTSIENIHRVIDPLFMDDLNAELDAIISLRPSKTRTQKLQKLQKKLGTLKFFDPACGSGNFLTEAYLSLRRLENRILSELSTQISFTDTQSETPIVVKISQFYGIEINDFAVSVARTALWIAEAQMWNETNSIIQFYGDLLPLNSYSNIFETNALLTDWHDIVKPDDKLYIMGNPPFLGYSIQNKQQKQEMLKVFCDEEGKPYKAAGKVDYVVGWYYKACEYITGTRVHAAFVSTNSITQGEQVGLVFKPLYERFGIHIDFAWTTFTWDSESEEKAQVHVVVIGFNAIKEEETGKQKRLYTPEGLKMVENINFYLAAAPNVFAEARPNPMQDDIPPAILGSTPRDDGGLIMTLEEMQELISENPLAEKFMRPFMGARDFIYRTPRYCLWLVNASPRDIKKCPRVMERIEKVKEFRLASTRPATMKFAQTSYLFAERRTSEKHYLAIPRTSSEERQYIPIDWLPPEVVSGDSMFMIPDAGLYHFGILTSRIHMAWTRTVCGRLKSDYRYSNTVVYNTFVWPEPSAKQRAKIERTAQMILDARAAHPECNYSELYDDNVMPADLRKAHNLNDAAVCEAYGFSDDISEMDIVAKLFEMYEAITA